MFHAIFPLLQCFASILSAAAGQVNGCGGKKVNVFVFSVLREGFLLSGRRQKPFPGLKTA
jgi:hypothetical protein